MDNNNSYIELVGAYLDGELVGDELASFESELNSNAALSAEVESQAEIINGIKEARKAELIARLDNIPISSGGISTSVLTKFVAGVVILGGIGFGTYQFFRPELVETIAEKSIVPEEIIEEKAQDPIASGAVEEKTATEVDADESAAKKEIANQDSEAAANDEVVVQPEIVMPAVPDPGEDIDNGVEDDLEIPKTEIGSPDVSESTTMEVDIVKHTRYNFHYQVSSGTLILYGKFNEEPYQIIEINVNTERQWYLYFMEKYYAIDKNMSDITPLEAITNESLIEELEKRKNKDS